MKTGKVNYSLPTIVIDKIKKIASDNGTTQTNILKNAITTYLYLANEVIEKNAKIIIEEGGVTKEIIFKELLQ